MPAISLDPHIALVRKFRAGGAAGGGGGQYGAGSGGELDRATRELPLLVDRHLDSANCGGAVEAILTVLTRANKLVNMEQPWVLARQRADGDAISGERLARLLDQLIAICLLVATELQPFVPDGAG